MASPASTLLQQRGLLQWLRSDFDAPARALAALVTCTRPFRSRELDAHLHLSAHRRRCGRRYPSHAQHAQAPTPVDQLVQRGATVGCKSKVNAHCADRVRSRSGFSGITRERPLQGCSPHTACSGSGLPPPHTACISTI
eukprot:scaffold140559_cov109-Phaeocystis_antarctica.AAC.1